MNVNYKIVEVWPQDHLIVARYWTDVLTEEMLASNDLRKEDGTPVRCRSDVSITLPVPEPDEKELEKLIELQAPINWLKTLEDVIDPTVDTSMALTKSLLNVTKTKTMDEIQALLAGQQSSNTLTDDEIQKMIEKISSQTSGNA